MLTVLEPAIKAPSAPIHGAIFGHMPLNQSAALCASTIGIEGRAPAALMSPDCELINTCTMGTAKKRAGAAEISVLPASPQPRLKRWMSILKMKMQAMAAIIRMVPGE